MAEERDSQQPTPRAAWFRVRPHLPLLAVLIVAAIPRFWLLGDDLPNLFNPDEGQIVNRAVGFGSGDLNPHWFVYGSFQMYLCFLCYGVYYGIGHLAGAFASLDEFAVAFVSDPTPFYLIARALSALAGVGTVAALYALARRHLGVAAAVVASGALALSPHHMWLSCHAQPDATVVFWMTLAVWSLSTIAASPDRIKWHVVFGLFSGLAVGTKILGALTAIPYIAVCLSCWRALGWKRASIGAGAALTAALAACFAVWPYFFLDFRSGPLSMSRVVAVSVSHGYTPLTLLRDYLASLADPAGWPFLAIVLIGTAQALRGADRLLRALAIYAPVTLALLAFQGRMQPNWALPLYPIVALMFAGGFRHVVEYVARCRGTTLVRPLVAALVLATAIPIPHRTLQRVIRAARPDTRILSRAWIESHVPPGTSVMIIGAFTELPQLRESEVSLRSKLELAETRRSDRFFHARRLLGYELMAASGGMRPAYDVVQLKPIWWVRRESDIDPYDKQAHESPFFDFIEDRPLEHYQAMGVRYVVTNEWMTRQFDTDAFPTYKAFFEQIRSTSELAAHFAESEQVSGPAISIWRVSAET